MCKGYHFETTKASVTSWREVSAGDRGLVPSTFERVCSGVLKMEKRLAACDCMFCVCPPGPDQLSLPPRNSELLEGRDGAEAG